MKKIILKSQMAVNSGRKALADLFLEKGGNLYNGALKRANTRALKAETKMQELEEQEKILEAEKAEKKAKKLAEKEARKANNIPWTQKVKDFFYDEEDDEVEDNVKRIYIKDQMFYDSGLNEYETIFCKDSFITRNYKASALFIKDGDDFIRVTSAEETELKVDDGFGNLLEVEAVILNTSMEDVRLYVYAMPPKNEPKIKK